MTNRKYTFPDEAHFCFPSWASPIASTIFPSPSIIRQNECSHGLDNFYSSTKIDSAEFQLCIGSSSVDASRRCPEMGASDRLLRGMLGNGLMVEEMYKYSVQVPL